MILLYTLKYITNTTTNQRLPSRILNSIVLWADPPSKSQTFKSFSVPTSKLRNKQTNKQQQKIFKIQDLAKSQETSSFCLLILVCTQVWMPYKWSTSDKLLLIFTSLGSLEAIIQISFSSNHTNHNKLTNLCIIS